MIINNNISALNTYRQLGVNNSANSKAMEKLSSGLRINRAGDDAAGLAISEKMRAQIRGLDQASRNSQDGISMIQTAEGALQESQNILQRMRELATQAANDSNVGTDREEIQKEINQLTSEINRIGNTTEFNTQKLINGDKDAVVDTPATAAKTVITKTDTTAAGTITIDGVGIDTDADETYDSIADKINNNSELSSKYTAVVNNGDLEIVHKTPGDAAHAVITGAGSGVDTDGVDATYSKTADETSLKFQIGANENQSMSLNIADMRASALGITTDDTTDSKLGVTDGTSSTIQESALSVLTHEDAAAAVTKFQEAIDKVSAERSKLGASQNRLEHTISNLNNSSENLQAAESRIRDVDMAKEVMEMTRTNILSQASQAMLAQANQKPQAVLQLLG
ncbi:flagellin [Cytobacillus kochii]|uniref:flagellin N-terminal helical domain-containing protein n=1 Tax=Cytobacillus kochii TaxID=859143 RepID=UPI001CD3B8E9|nr:flagellin [Cytobacillus kochii]MCA1026808.1 flagellin [Cytobacillus kochii]